MHADWRVYVINLDRSVDRWQAVSAHATHIGITPIRVAAIDGIDGIDVGTFVDLERFHLLHHALLRPAEVGCYASHLKTLELFLGSDAAHCVILEDDTIPTDRFPAALDDLARWAGLWDIVKLNWRHLPGAITRAASANGNLISLTLRTSGSGAYAVNRHAAEVLLARLRPMVFPYDWAFDRVWDSGLRLRGYDPQPVLQAAVPSLIMSTPALDPTRPSIKGNKLHKPWRQQAPTFLYRAWCEVRRVWYALITDGGLRARLRAFPSRADGFAWDGRGRAISGDCLQLYRSPQQHVSSTCLPSPLSAEDPHGG